MKYGILVFLCTFVCFGEQEKTFSVKDGNFACFNISDVDSSVYLGVAFNSNSSSEVWKVSLVDFSIIWKTKIMPCSILDISGDSINNNIMVHAWYDGNEYSYFADGKNGTIEDSLKQKRCAFIDCNGKVLLTDAYYSGEDGIKLSDIDKDTSIDKNLQIKKIGSNNLSKYNFPYTSIDLKIYNNVIILISVDKNRPDIVEIYAGNIENPNSLRIVSALKSIEDRPGITEKIINDSVVIFQNKFVNINSNAVTVIPKRPLRENNHKGLCFIAEIQDQIYYYDKSDCRVCVDNFNADPDPAMVIAKLKDNSPSIVTSHFFCIGNMQRDGIIKENDSKIVLIMR